MFDTGAVKTGDEGNDGGISGWVGAGYSPLKPCLFVVRELVPLGRAAVVNQALGLFGLIAVARFGRVAPSSGSKLPRHSDSVLP